MKTVNPWFFEVPLGPLAGLAELEEEVIKYANLDPNDSKAVRKVIRDLIVPYVNSLPSNILDAVKTSYRFCLSEDRINFERSFDAKMPPFAAPDDAKSLFIWIWEECFPGESYHIHDLDSYVVKGGPNDVIQMFGESRSRSSKEPHS